MAGVAAPGVAAPGVLAVDTPAEAPARTLLLLSAMAEGDAFGPPLQAAPAVAALTASRAIVPRRAEWRSGRDTGVDDDHTARALWTATNSAITSR